MLLSVVSRDVAACSSVQSSTQVSLEVPCLPRIVILVVLVLVHLAHVLDHSVSVVLGRTY